MQWWQAILLGLVQGFTEFLPVSSSGHLMLVKALLGLSSEGFWDFTMTVHLATVLSILCVFYREVTQLAKGFFSFRYNKETDYVLKIIVSVIPVAVVGIFFKKFLDQIFEGTLLVVAFSLLVTSLLLFISEKMSKKGEAEKEFSEGKSLNEISYFQAFIVGIAQAFAVLPGLSRSGTTIATGLILGIKRSAIAQFSFMMVLIPVIGDQILSAFSIGASSNLGFEILSIAFVSSFLSGLLACKMMIAIVKRHSLLYFSVYCILLALCIFLLN